uniref:Uncharacterized protein n=1 Tax=Hyaloperonospora arabidopsidis (strain Emoy2) TaxID=559515 RepID=M4BXW5_HYAAE
MAALARRRMGSNSSNSTNSSRNSSNASAQSPVATTGGFDADLLGFSAAVSSPLPCSAQHDETGARKEQSSGPYVLPSARRLRMAPLRLLAMTRSILQASLRVMDTSAAESGLVVPPETGAVETEAVTVTVEDDDDGFSQDDESNALERPSDSSRALPGCATTLSETSRDTNDGSIMYAVALLRKLQQHAGANERGEAEVQRKELDQILHGFIRALETMTLTWGKRSVKNTVQTLFDAHAHVFDDSMQNFFIQHFLHESEGVKTFRTALHRTSMLRRCLLAMYQTECGDSAKRIKSLGDDNGIAARCWSNVLAQITKPENHACRLFSIEECPELTNPSTVRAVEHAIAKVDSWDFDVFAVRC